MEKIKSEVRFNMHKIYFHSEIKCFNHFQKITYLRKETDQVCGEHFNKLDTNMKT